jgi:hypothetical protein
MSWLLGRAANVEATSMITETSEVASLADSPRIFEAVANSER